MAYPAHRRIDSRATTWPVSASRPGQGLISTFAHSPSARHRRGGRLEGGHPLTGEGVAEPAARVEALQVGKAGAGHGAVTVGGAVEGVVMHEDGHAIRSQLDVELDPGVTEAGRQPQAGQRVLRGQRAAAPVGQQAREGPERASDGCSRGCALGFARAPPISGMGADAGIILVFSCEFTRVKMPIYEYRCRSCGFEKEYLQKLSDAPITDCPSCGKAEMTKLVSAAGFQLKGVGWYATDFKNNGAAKKDGVESKGGRSRNRTGEGRAKRRNPGVRTPRSGSSSEKIRRPPREKSAPLQPAARAPVQPANRHLAALGEEILHHRAADLDPAGHHALGAEPDREHHGQTLLLLPEALQPQSWLGFHIPGWAWC